MKRALMVVQILCQAAGLTLLTMATLAGLVFLGYCLVALTQLTFWGAVVPAAAGLFAAFCGFLFAAREPETPEGDARSSESEAGTNTGLEVRVCKLQRSALHPKRLRDTPLSGGVGPAFGGRDDDVEEASGTCEQGSSAVHLRLSHEHSAEPLKP